MVMYSAGGKMTIFPELWDQLLPTLIRITPILAFAAPLVAIIVAAALFPYRVRKELQERRRARVDTLVSINRALTAEVRRKDRTMAMLRREILDGRRSMTKCLNQQREMMEIMRTRGIMTVGLERITRSIEEELHTLEVNAIEAASEPGDDEVDEDSYD